MKQEPIDLGAGRKVKKIASEVSTTPAEVTPAKAPEPETKPEADKVAIPQFKRKRNPQVGEKPGAKQLFRLTGTTKSGYDFTTLSPDQPLLLVPDPYGLSVKPETGHPDPTAVSVQDLNGKHIAYVNAKDKDPRTGKSQAETTYAGLSSGKWSYMANVREVLGGNEAEDGKPKYGVDIAVLFFKE